MRYIIKSLILAIMPLATTTINSATLEIGSEVPSFAANDDSGEIWNLADHLGKDNIVVYFYPAAMTGGCTAQACSYRDFSSQLTAEDAIVVGVSGDSVKGLSLFKQAHDLNFTLLSDPNGSIAEHFGVPTREGGSLEREINGELHTLKRNLTTSRWTFIISKDGEIVYQAADVNAKEDASSVLAELAKLK